jgi:heat shock protein HtpX
MKRIFLFLLTNIAVMVVISIVTSLLGVNKYLTSSGLNLPMLLAFSAVVGFTGSIISLLISKPMAKWSTGAQVITNPQNSNEIWLLHTVQKLSMSAGISMPEVAIYEGEPNAFATGASKNNSLIAVSTGLLYNMSQKEVEGVLAHEVAHIANGDMVTLTLIQGVVNTFVIFLARVVAYGVDNFVRKDENRSGVSWTYTITVFVCEILFGILASIVVMYFSRQREYRADAGAVKIMNDKQPMILALQKLLHLQTGGLPDNMASAGIAENKAKYGFSLANLFVTHPPLEERIATLQNAH